MKLRTGSLLFPLLLGTLALAANVSCATNATPPMTPSAVTKTNPPATPAPISSDSNVVGDVVSGPFQDLNLMKTDIPPVLVGLNGQPYNSPVDGTCTGLATEVTALDAVLGPDLDVLTKGGRPIGSMAAKALTQASHSLVPYRSWIRKLSGAEKRAERLAAALLTGTARRAFLKGLGVAQGCEPPAAPLPRAPAVEPERATTPSA